MHSLLGKAALFFFATTAVVIVIFSLVINYQISEHFSQYLNMYQGQGMHGMMGTGRGMMMGMQEQEFLGSLRHSLALTAVIMLLIGAAISFYFARGIALPIIELNKAAKSVAEGNLDITVKVDSRDEVGQLANAFNDMAANLKTNNVLRQRFLAGVAHELRTPLTILRANLEGMADGVVEASEEQLNSLNEEVVRITKMVEDLRDLSLLEAGKTRLEFAEVEINGLLKDVSGKLKLLAASKGIDLNLSLGNVPLVRADAVRVRQIVDNLAINALNYTLNGGSVTISSMQADNKVLISVRDTGVGISCEHLAHIFDHFYRVDQSRAKNSGGTGLGLAVVKQLAVAQGGEVSAESIPGKGSTFTVRLPIAVEKT